MLLPKSTETRGSCQCCQSLGFCPKCQDLLSLNLLINLRRTCTVRVMHYEFHIFTTLTTEDVYSISIVQQCRMLEAPLATDIVNQCLTTLNDAVSIVRSGKKPFLERDFELIISSYITHPSVKHTTQIAETRSWKRI